MSLIPTSFSRLRTRLGSEGSGLTWQGGAQVVTLIAAEALLLYWVNQFYPLQHWLFFIYAQTWLWTGLFALSSLLSGLTLLRFLSSTAWRGGEELVVGSALGVLLFFTGMVLCGLLSLYGPVFAILWPLFLLTVGAKEGVRLWRRFRRCWQQFGARLVRPRSTIELLAFALLLLALVGIYLQVLNPLNPAADAHWYHLGIADQYAAAGGFVRFNEGWYLGAYPHLASVLYTWALLVPAAGGRFTQMAVASHLELSLLLWTLLGVSVLCRRLIGNGRYPYASAALFLFPGIFLYDSSLGTAADHVLAFWAPALAIACLRLSRSHDWRSASVLGLLFAGSLLTKLQGLYFFPYIALTLIALAIRYRSLVPLFVSAGVCVLAMSTHWLKNLLWYGDPYYPLMRRWFPSKPFHPGAEALLEEVFWYDRFRLTGTPAENAMDTLSALVTFSFVPNNWENFHRDVPVFGFLFTLLLPALLFTRGTKRIWLLIGGAHFGIFVWYITSHQDRYLQALLPWMAPIVAAALILLWRQGILQKSAATLLVLTQVIWGADVYFFRTHGMIGNTPIKSTADFISSGFYANKNEDLYQKRLRTWGGLQDVGKEIPQGAVVLLHDVQERMGLGHVAVKDAQGWQGLISYPHLGSPKEAYAQLSKLKVTHLVWRAKRPGLPRRQLASEAVFAEMAALYASAPERVGAYSIAQLNVASRPASPPTQSKIAIINCTPEPASGIYTPLQLHNRQKPTLQLPLNAQGRSLSASLKEASSAILFTGCPESNKQRRALRKQFRRHAGIKDTAIFVRKQPR